jgi:hypothetical protein
LNVGYFTQYSKTSGTGSEPKVFIDNASYPKWIKSSLEEEELDRIRAYYERLAERAHVDLRRGLRDTGVPDVEEPDTPTNA